jgi:predicted dehydrogenase
MIKIGIVGFGFMGRTHFMRYDKIPGVEVTAIADRELNRQQGDFIPGGNLDLGVASLDLENVSVFSEAEELIHDPKIDLVDICLPTFLHVKYAIESFRNGKHVICEKPIALNYNEGKKMVDASRASECHLFIAQVIRFWPEYNYLYELQKRGELGMLHYLSLYRRAGPVTWTWDDWNKDKKLSGGVIDIRIHDIDFVNYLLGKPEQIYAQAAPGLDVVLSQYVYEADAFVSIESNRLLPQALVFEAGFDAIFEGGTLRYRGQEENSLILYRKPSSEPQIINVSGDAYLNELRYFIECIKSGQHEVGWDSSDGALEALRLWEQEIYSAETGKVVRADLSQKVI